MIPIDELTITSGSWFIMMGLYAMIVGIFGGFLDYCIFRKGGSISRLMKFIGNVIELAIVWVVCIYLREGFLPLQGLLLFPITGIMWWIAHDMSLGLLLKGSVWYIGETGWDKKMREMFQDSGFLYFVVRMWVLIIFAGSYLSYTGPFWWKILCDIIKSSII